MTTVAACTLLVLGALLSFANWSLIARWLIARKSGSMVPFLGGLLGFAGCALLPAVGWKLGLIAFAIDPGCGWLCLAVLAFGPSRWMRSRRDGG